MNFFAKVEGGKELRAALIKQSEEFLNAMQDELSQQGAALTAAGVSAAPRRTGELRSKTETQVKFRRNRTSFGYLSFFTSDYAAAVHEGVFGGTKKQLASFKWWSRIFDGQSDAILSAVEARLRTVAGGD